MSKFLKRSSALGLSIATTVLTFVPDSIIGSVKISDKWTDEKNLLFDRIGILVVAFLPVCNINWNI